MLQSVVSFVLDIAIPMAAMSGKLCAPAYAARATTASSGSAKPAGIHPSCYIHYRKAQRNNFPRQ